MAVVHAPRAERHSMYETVAITQRLQRLYLARHEQLLIYLLCALCSQRRRPLERTAAADYIEYVWVALYLLIEGEKVAGAHARREEECRPADRFCA